MSSEDESSASGSESGSERRNRMGRWIGFDSDRSIDDESYESDFIVPDHESESGSESSGIHF